MSNTFRKQYRELTEDEKAHIEQIKDTAERLEMLIRHISAYAVPAGEKARHIALAITNLEQAVMWAVKAAT
jgi:archaellum component FlaC